MVFLFTKEFRSVSLSVRQAVDRSIPPSDHRTNLNFEIRHLGKAIKNYQNMLPSSFEGCFKKVYEQIARTHMMLEYFQTSFSGMGHKPVVVFLVKVALVVFLMLSMVS